MVKKFTIPFASQGDANDIPDALQVDGKVSFTQGFGYDYERPYDDPQAKDIAREDMNGLFKAITSAVGELQTLGASEWSSAISYPKGAIVYYEKDLYISQVDDNQNKPPQNWVSITSIANDSLKKAANLSDLTNKSTARNNLGLGNSATLNKTDVLGTSTSLVATQKLVNDTKINLDNSVRAVDIKSDNAQSSANTAQSTANTAVTKADNAQSRADSAYNLASSKRNLNDALFKTGELLIRTENNAPILDIKHELGEPYFWIYNDRSLIIPTNEQSGSTLATREFVRNYSIGIIQKTFDLTSQRSSNVLYTNSTVRPIFIAISITMPKRGLAQLFVDDVLVFETDVSDSSAIQTLCYIIPPSSNYKLITDNQVRLWSELR